MIPAYLVSDHLVPQMKQFPDGPFLVRPDDWTIIDGDTFRVRTGLLADGRRHDAFRIRLSTIDTPELRKPALFDRVLAACPDPMRDGPGERARDHLKALCCRRVILVTPPRDPDGRASTDRYGRLLGQVCVSGRPGSLFSLDGAFSVEHALLEAGMAQVLPGHVAPPRHPEILARIQESIDALMTQEMAAAPAPAMMPTA